MEWNTGMDEIWLLKSVPKYEVRFQFGQYYFREPQVHVDKSEGIQINFWDRYEMFKYLHRPMIAFGISDAPLPNCY